MPSLIDGSLDRSAMVSMFGKPRPKATSGIVALVPSEARTADWKQWKATIATTDTIEKEVESLRNGDRTNTLVIVNRYDGIDLPDDVCRVLVLDSKPFAESLIDTHAERCRADSEITAIRTARTIEQGLGRSVRGEKDYCVVVLIGEDLVKAVRSGELRKHLSAQTKAQIEIGLEIAEMSKDDIVEGKAAKDVFVAIAAQCLQRNADWKAFYAERMDAVTTPLPGGAILDIFQSELKAETHFLNGEVDQAVSVLQKLVDDASVSELDKGWYLQDIARFRFRQDKAEANRIQIAAHKRNSYILKPRSGMVVEKLQIISQARIERLVAWVQQCGTYSDLVVHVTDILARLSFGVKAHSFEGAVSDLATALGFRRGGLRHSRGE